MPDTDITKQSRPNRRKRNFAFLPGYVFYANQKVSAEPFIRLYAVAFRCFAKDKCTMTSKARAAVMSVSIVQF